MKKQVKIGLGAAALALAAALCAGGTLAGWRTSSTVTNHISTATVQGIVEEKYEQGQTITPGQTVEKCVWVKNTGTASSLVRAKVVIDWDDETAADMDATDCVFPAYNTADWTQGEDGYWYYNDIVEQNQCSTALFESFTVSPNLTNELAGRTGIVCDEFYLLFRYEYSSNFFYKLWKRIRKYNGLITGLTQNVDELLRSDTARLMLANSEFLIMLNQSATDRGELAKLLNISDTQLGYITNVPAGCGLIRCAGNLVPFTNSFPTDTKLYRLMTTKPDERLKE